MATMVTVADRSRGVCHVNVVMTATKKTSTTATAYATQIRLVWRRPAAAIVKKDETALMESKFRKKLIFISFRINNASSNDHELT